MTMSPPDAADIAYFAKGVFEYLKNISDAHRRELLEKHGGEVGFVTDCCDYTKNIEVPDDFAGGVFAYDVMHPFGWAVAAALAQSTLLTPTSVRQAVAVLITKAELK